MWFKRRKTIFEVLTDAYGGPFVCRVVEAKGRFDPDGFSLRFQRGRLEYFVSHGRFGYTVLVGVAAFPDRMTVTREHHHGLVEFGAVRRELGLAATAGGSLEEILAQLVALEPQLKTHFLTEPAPFSAPPPADEADDEPVGLQAAS
jgi:hypothetical protein